MKKLPFCLLMMVLAWLIAGCAPRGGAVYEEPPMGDIVYPTMEPATAGAIAAPGQGLFLFEDAKARNVGDILTINLTESTSAEKSASTSTSKSAGVSVGTGIFFGNAVPEAETELSAGRTFDGSGDSEQSNRLSGTVTVFVVQRLPNGNLVIRGDKQLRLNQGSEVVRIEGVVRPQDISPDNTVSSTRVGNARLVYAGRGALADSNAQGWLSRFFSSPWIPF